MVAYYNALPSTDTTSIEAFINSGGAVGDAQQALARGNKAASAGVSAGVAVASAAMGVAGSGAVATATTAALTSVSSSLVAAGAVSATVPVVGWVVAGVLVAAAGGISIGARRRAKFLSKDRGLLERYIKRFERKSADWRLKEARKQISKIQFVMTRRQSKFNMKRKAKAELKLEALYYIYKKENFSGAQQAAQLARFQQISLQRQEAFQRYLPVYIGLGVITSILLVYAVKQKD